MDTDPGEVVEVVVGRAVVDVEAADVVVDAAVVDVEVLGEVVGEEVVLVVEGDVVVVEDCPPAEVVVGPLPAQPTVANTKPRTRARATAITG